MHVPNLHTAPKRHLIKIRTFSRNIDSYLGAVHMNRASLANRAYLTHKDLNFSTT